MALLPIIYAPDNRLKLKCQEVHEIDESVCKLMDDMLETMYAAPGIGLSAPQVGDNRRILVCDVAREKEAPNPMKMVNPIVYGHQMKSLLQKKGVLVCRSILQRLKDLRRFV